MNITRFLSLSILAVFLCVSAAHAATVTVSAAADIPGNVIFTSTTGPGQSLNTPYVVRLNVGELTLIDAAIVDSPDQGKNFYRQVPDGGDGNFLAVFQVKEKGSATLDLNKGATALSFNWGSIEADNFVTVSNDSGYTKTFSYADLQAAATGTLLGLTKYVTFSGLPKIKHILFSDTGSNTFEIRDLSLTMVPLPGAILLFGSALGGATFLRRRHSKKA